MLVVQCSPPSPFANSLRPPLHSFLCQRAASLRSKDPRSHTKNSKNYNNVSWHGRRYLNSSCAVRSGATTTGNNNHHHHHQHQQQLNTKHSSSAESKLWSALSLLASTIGSKSKSLASTTANVTATANATAATASQINDKQVKHVYSASTSPSGLPLSKMFSVKFPLSIKQSFADYKRRNQLLDIQNDLLSLLKMENLTNLQMEVKKVPIYLDSAGRVIKHKDLLDPVSKPPGNLEFNYINEVCISSKNTSATDTSNVKHFILLHGYGAGLGFFIKNIEQLAQYLNLNPDQKWCIHALDLLGCGNSSRPEINYNTNNSLEAFETWFADSLENWRIQRNLDIPENNLVVAHSLGAYLSVCYNIKYPKTFKKLVLVSPAGMIKPMASKLRKAPKWFEYLWNKNVSPFALVRYTGPLGSLFVSGWTSRRFARLIKQEHDLLHKYAYGIFNARGSGEYFLNYVLSAGGVPRFPLVKNKERLSKITCDTEWLYGGNDWMDQRGGQIACKYLSENNGLKANLKIFEGCGHHIYLDDIKGFNNYLIEKMEMFAAE